MDGIADKKYTLLDDAIKRLTRTRTRPNRRGLAHAYSRHFALSDSFRTLPGVAERCRVVRGVSMKWAIQVLNVPKIADS